MIIGENEMFKLYMIKRLKTEIIDAKRLLEFSKGEVNMFEDIETKSFYKGQVQADKFYIDKLKALLTDVENWRG